LRHLDVTITKKFACHAGAARMDICERHNLFTPVSFQLFLFQYLFYLLSFRFLSTVPFSLFSFRFLSTGLFLVFSFRFLSTVPSSALSFLFFSTLRVVAHSFRFFIQSRNPKRQRRCHGAQRQAGSNDQDNDRGRLWTPRQRIRVINPPAAAAAAAEPAPAPAPGLTAVCNDNR
jgi:hypothetical protein